jgi:23S rRNA pseudouridine2605 synthase
MTLDGQRLQPAKVRLVRRDGDQSVLSVIIHEGKNRQIRRMCASCGLEVRRLKRIREGELTLDRTLTPGQWRPLDPEERERLTREIFLQE